MQIIVCKQLLIANIDRRIANNDYCFQISCYAVFYLIARTELVDDASSDHSFSSLWNSNYESEEELNDRIWDVETESRSFCPP